MQPIPAQDRPKLIAVVIGIVIALALVVRNLFGTQTLAQPLEERKVTTNTASAPPAEPADRPAPAAAEAGDTPAAAVDEGLEPVELAPFHDPFQPVEKSEPVSAPAAAAAAAVPAIAKASAPVLPLVISTPARPAAVAIAVRSSVPAPRAEPDGDRPAAPAQPVVKSAATAPAAPAEEVRLVGTVRQDPSALAVFRTSERAVFVRPKEVISHWRVVGIEDGQVSLSHNNTRELIHVGEMLPSVP